MAVHKVPRVPVLANKTKAAFSSRRLVRDVLVGLTPSDEQIIRAVTSGLVSAVLDDLVDCGLSIDEIAGVVGVSKRTLHRKRASHVLLDVAESDRTIRLARIIADADTSIGDHTKALHWLRTPNWALGNAVPLHLLATEPGVEMVRQSLATIAFGGVA